MNENDTDQQAGPMTYRETYAARLAEAIDALTAAARIPRPRLTQNDAGEWVEDTAAAPEQMDWAEFVTLALAGAAANLGGIEAALSGRSGSWEAAGVRQLLESTVGPDEAHLWVHRTEPVNITLYVDELISEHGHDIFGEYDAAEAEIGRRYEAAEQSEPQIDYDRYVWSYDRASSGEWIGRTAETPAWSWDAWRNQPWRDYEVDNLATIEEQARTSDLIEGLSIAKSPEAAEELWQLEDERDAKLAVFGELEERLEQQRRAEWTSYGEALKTRIEATARAIPGLDVGVNVTLDIDTYRQLEQQRRDDRFWNSLETRLVEAALLDTPTPADLPGTPLERLGAS
jgi:hypothetical protein